MTSCLLPRQTDSNNPESLHPKAMGRGDGMVRQIDAEKQSSIKVSDYEGASVTLSPINKAQANVVSLDEVVIKAGLKRLADNAERAPVPGLNSVDHVNLLNIESPTSAGVNSELNASKIEYDAENAKAIQATLREVRSRYKQITKKHNRYGWTLNEIFDDGVFKGCELSTGTTQLEQSTYTAQLWLEIKESSLFVNTTASLGRQHSNSGLTLDSDRNIPFTQSYFGNGFMLDNESLIKVMKSKRASVFVSGGELGQEIFEADLLINQLRDLYPIYRTCNNLG